MSSFFKDQVNHTLAGLDWTAADSLETLGMMKGEIKVKKRMTFSMAIALTVMVFGMALGIAEIIRYSVTDYHGLDTEFYQEHIIPIQKEDKNEDISIFLNDAVFDGERMVLAMEIQPVSGETVYLVPQLRGTSAGKSFESHIAGSRGGDFNEGFWVGKAGELNFTDGKYGFDAQVHKEYASDELSWNLTFDVLKPVWDIAMDTSGYADDSDGGINHTEWEKLFKEAYQNKKIMLGSQYDLMMFSRLLPGQEGDPLAQRLIDSGAFKSAGSLKVEFVTPNEHSNISSIAGKTLEFDGYNIRIESLDVSFMRASYAFTVNITDPAGKLQLYVGDNLIDFHPVANGQSLRMVTSAGGVSDVDSPKTGALYTGEFIGIGEMPEEVTFKPFYYDAQGNSVELEIGEFTVPLK